MTNNHTLKNDCKRNLDAIRRMLPADERQKIEPFLRDILDVTKKLMGNVKVSPEEHQALTEEFQRLKQERKCYSATIARLNRELEHVAKLQAKIQETVTALDKDLNEVPTVEIAKVGLATKNKTLVKCGNHHMAPAGMICIHLADQTSTEWRSMIPLFDPAEDSTQFENDWLCRECFDRCVATQSLPDLDDIRTVCIYCIRDLMGES